MNTLGFFVCWILIGIFVFVTLPKMANNWQKHHYDERHTKAIDDEISSKYEFIDDSTNIIGASAVYLIMAVLYLLLILAWPIAVPLELAYRKSIAKKIDKRES